MGRFHVIIMEGYENDAANLHQGKGIVTCNSETFGSTDDAATDDSITHTRPGNAAESKELRRDLNMRHLCFLALGSGVGTGLFMGSGNILKYGGPGSLMISFVLLGFMVITVIFAVGELVSVFPSSASYAEMLKRFVHPSAGFAIGINYVTTWLIILPTELTVSCMAISYWDKDEVVPKGVWVAIILIAVFSVNLFGVRFFGEFEMLTTSIKMAGCIGFIVACIVFACGGANSEHVGAHYWHQPGAFKNSFKGFCNSFAFTALAYGGTEIIGVTVGESSHPRRHLPKAAKYVVYRVLIFFILSLFMVSLLVPSDNPELSNYSPFVMAIESGGVRALPQIFNAVTLISFISVANAAVYTASRLLYTMAEKHFIPSIFLFSDKHGRPIAGYIFVFLFGLLGFLVYSSSEDEVFNWLGSISGMSVILLWFSIALAHIRFRFAWKRAGHSVKDLPWSSPLGIWGSLIALTLNMLVLMATFYISVFPIDEAQSDGYARAKEFFQSYLSVVIMLFSFFLHLITTRSKFIRLSDIDLQTGRRDPNEGHEWEFEKGEVMKPRWRRILDIFF